jgi:hypothetical protein
MPAATSEHPSPYQELQRLEARLRLGIEITNATGAGRVITQGINQGRIKAEDEDYLRSLIPKYYTKEEYVGDPNPEQRKLDFAAREEIKKESHRGAENILRKLAGGNYSKRSIAIASAMKCHTMQGTERDKVLLQIHRHFDEKEGVVAPSGDIPPPPPARSALEKANSLAVTWAIYDCEKAPETVRWMLSRLRQALKAEGTLEEVIEFYTHTLAKKETTQQEQTGDSNE